MNLDEKPTLIRVDFNVPLSSESVIEDDTRIRAALETIREAQKRGARVTLASHLGRPHGRDERYSLLPIAERLSELLSQDVLFAPDCVGDGVRKLVQELRPEQVLLLENLRFYAGEELNDDAFAKQLAQPFTAYINDAFGAAHRAHASVVAITRHIKLYGAGLLLMKEMKQLERLSQNPDKPYVAILGGAKVSDKINLLNRLLTQVDTLLIGGAMAYTFLAARGVNVGASRVEADKLSLAKAVMEKARARNVDLQLPVDHVASTLFSEDSQAVNVDTQALPEHLMGLDIGPQTRKNFARALQGAQTIFWNGPMGVFEWSSYAEGSMAVAHAVADSAAYSVVGGGDSVAAVQKAGVAAQISHISTGGGASLEFLEGQSLAGIQALERPAS